MRRRGCLWGLTGVIGLLALCCVLAFFVGLPRLQDSIRDEVAEQLSTQVARQLDAQVSGGVAVGAGEYRLSLSDIEQQIAADADPSTVETLDLRADGNELVLSIATDWETIEYRGIPTAGPTGELEMADMRSDGGGIDYLLPPDQVGGAIERGVNSYLQARGLQLQDIQLDRNDLILNLVE
ncbi:MAG TPA: hypothetical protein VGR29_09810 [Thermomicrobiales bacterium]|nr:hypothetical protein [Thermomicrobiales bacterium]